MVGSNADGESLAIVGENTPLEGPATDRSGDCGSACRFAHRWKVSIKIFASFLGPTLTQAVSYGSQRQI